jgi:hypothetical protein
MSKQSTMTAEHRRRQSLRVHLETTLHASISGDRRGTGRVRDLAVGGAFLETEQHFEANDSIHVEISSGSQSFQSDAKVRNITSLGIGIEFVEMKPDEREHLRLLITGLLT